MNIQRTVKQAGHKCNTRETWLSVRRLIHRPRLSQKVSGTYWTPGPCRNNQEHWRSRTPRIKKQGTERMNTKHTKNSKHGTNVVWTSNAEHRSKTAATLAATLHNNLTRTVWRREQRPGDTSETDEQGNTGESDDTAQSHTAEDRAHTHLITEKQWFEISIYKCIYISLLLTYWHFNHSPIMKCQAEQHIPVSRGREAWHLLHMWYILFDSHHWGQWQQGNVPQTLWVSPGLICCDTVFLFNYR